MRVGCHLQVKVCVCEEDSNQRVSFSVLDLSGEVKDRKPISALKIKGLIILIITLIVLVF